MTAYSKTMGQALREVYDVMLNDVVESQLVEGTIDKIKDIVSKKQHSKIDGVTVDLFTASAISQIYDKVNDANKKKMEKLPITKLAALAMKMMKNEYVPEEVDLDEAKSQDMFVVLEKGSKNKVLGVEKQKKNAMAMMKKNAGSKVIQIGKFATVDDKPVDIKVGDELSYTRVKLSTKVKEETDLDEGSWHIAKNMNALKKKMQKPIFKNMSRVKFVMKHIGDDELTDEMFDAKTGTDMVPMIKSAMKRLNIKEEVDLDEHKGDKPHKHPHVNEAESGDPDDQYDDEEERQVSEGRMKDLHGYIQDGKTAEQIAKLMKLDVKTIKSLMAGYNESAASDARRAIAKDKDFKVGKVDDADKDTHFDPRKDKAASANIIMQLRKAGNRASMGVEFGDGKKHKVPPQIAQKVQSKYNSYSRPAEKQAFQSKIAKSYKDMLKALKEDYSPIKETILDRIAHKLMERKND